MTRLAVAFFSLALGASAQSDEQTEAAKKAVTAMVRAYEPRIVEVVSAAASEGVGPSALVLGFPQGGYDSYAEPFYLTLERAKFKGKSVGQSGAIVYMLADVDVLKALLPKWQDWRTKARENAVTKVEKQIERTEGTDHKIVYVFSVSDEGHIALKIIGESGGRRFGLFLAEDEVPAFVAAVDNLAEDVRNIYKAVPSYIKAQEQKKKNTDELFK